MKNEPWRGIPEARLLHLERKLSNKKKRIRDLEREKAQLREIIDELEESLSAYHDAEVAGG